MAKPILLIIDDDEAFLASSRRALQNEYDVRCAQSAPEADDLLSPLPEVVLLDLSLKEDDPANREGLVILNKLHQQFPQIPILIITAYGEIETAVECMKTGAVDFLQKPRADIREIKARIQKAVEHSRLSRRVSQLEEDLRLIEPREIVGESASILQMNRVIEAVASNSYVTVLLVGETGTGKELVARAIHRSGWRRSGPFVPVMLNALSQAMLEAELFGHEAGAFTDARDRHVGYLEKAHGGTLFLDEVGEMDANIQVKLLRFLEEREFQRLGSTIPVKVDVQIVAATNVGLEGLVKEKRFREDLYFRLKVHEILLPPLRDRVDDIPLLVDHFLRLFRRQGKNVLSIAPGSLKVLQGYPWPGNVRQLRNALESAALRAQVSGRQRITEPDLPAEVRAGESPQVRPDPADSSANGFTIHETLARTELLQIEDALRTTHGKKAEAGRLLGYSDRFTMQRRVRKILKIYPHLGAEFSQLKTNFKAGSTSGSPESHFDAN